MSMLETDDLTKKFGELTAVDRVDLEIEREGIHSIIGPNGAGKSTLFHLLTGYHHPTEGTITYRGEDITGLPPRKVVRRGISRSFQIIDLFEGLTVRENVQIAVQSRDEQRNSMWKSADSLAGVQERTDEVLGDLGLIDVADARVDALSYGNQRILEIGLAIAVDPDLLLLDEPTAGLGKEASIELMDLVQRIIEENDIKLIVIEHDIEMVMEISDRIVVLHRGGVLAEGTPSEIRANEDVQDAYMGTGEN